MGKKGRVEVRSQARRYGKSYRLILGMVLGCARRKATYIFQCDRKGQAQAIISIRKHAEAMSLRIEVAERFYKVKDIESKRIDISFANGSRITILSQKPDSV